MGGAGLEKEVQVVLDAATIFVICAASGKVQINFFFDRRGGPTLERPTMMLLALLPSAGALQPILTQTRLAGNVKFDPLNLATVDLHFKTDRSVARGPDDILWDYREAELTFSTTLSGLEGRQIALSARTQPTEQNVTH